MSRFAPIALIVACLAAPASAFTFSLTDLSFPDSATTVSTQSCDPASTAPVSVCK